jgi:hypothetical protein
MNVHTVHTSSSFSSVYNVNCPYTDGKMLMPGQVSGFEVYEPKTYREKEVRDKLMIQRQRLFIAEINGHIDEEYLNDFVNFPPIFRKLEISLDRETIGDLMYNYLLEMNHGKEINKREKKKLTMLLSTHDQFMSFSSY